MWKVQPRKKKMRKISVNREAKRHRFAPLEKARSINRKIMRAAPTDWRKRQQSNKEHE